MRVRLVGAIFAASATLAAAAAVRADEIKLKDGSKITGTVVAIENGSYKIQTSYGYAVVEKDKIAAIIPTGAETPKPAKEAKPAAEEPKEEKAEKKGKGRKKKAEAEEAKA